jgi:hypothetical protein
MYVPETSFDDAEKMEPISGVLLVNKDRKRIKCAVCKTAKGAVVQCDHPGCKMSWHPLCGIEEVIHAVKMRIPLILWFSFLVARISCFRSWEWVSFDAVPIPCTESL